MLYRGEEKSPSTEEKTNSLHRAARNDHRLVHLEVGRDVEQKTGAATAR
jgi:hypothetical protein